MKYAELVEVYRRLESTSKRLEKTNVLSGFLKTATELDKVILLVQGRVFPNWDQRELGMASKLVLKAVSVASGASVEKIEEKFRVLGDIGLVAEDLMKSKSQSTLFSQELTVGKVFENLRKIAELEGEGVVDRKAQLVAELLTSAKPLEARYIVRTILNDLRVGLGDGTIRDAIVWAFFAEKIGLSFDTSKNELVLSDEQRKVYDEYCDKVQESIDIANDFAEVISLVKLRGEDGLSQVSLKVGKPVKVMLYQKAKTIEAGLETVGKPAAVEFKYDGFRLQIHKSGEKVTLFTRRFEDVTAQFPDVVKCAKECVKDDSCILDSEAVGIDKITKKYLPFQSISQRIKRKYDIEDIAEKFPIEVMVFDVLFANGQSLLKSPYSVRRAMVTELVRDSKVMKPSSQCVTDDGNIAEEFYQRSLAAGNEGVMMKNLEGIYKPGCRVGFGVKVKPTMDTLEVVITGAEWGEGKRSAWLASFVIAVRDGESGEFVEIGRVGTGIKEKVEEGVSFEQLTNLLRPLIIEEKGREVKVRPIIVIEVDYEEIQTSPTYSSGFALRFPRLVRLREDRIAGGVNSLEDIKSMAHSQRGR